MICSCMMSLRYLIILCYTLQEGLCLEYLAGFGLWIANEPLFNDLWIRTSGHDFTHTDIFARNDSNNY